MADFGLVIDLKNTKTTTSTNINTTRDTSSEKLGQLNERNFIQQATGRRGKDNTL